MLVVNWHEVTDGSGTASVLLDANQTPIADATAVALIDVMTCELVYVVRCGLDGEFFQDGLLRVKEGIAGQVAQISAPMAIPDVRAVLDGSLEKIETVPDPVFGLGVPATVPGVPSEVLDPRSTWSDPAAYDAKARDLAARFAENFKQFADKVDPKVVAAGPRV